MPSISLFLPHQDATLALGKALGSLLIPGDLVTLSGTLGAGKTTLAQGLAQSLGVMEPVSSPTFVLMNEYEGRIPLLHLDAYRLENLEWDELRDAGIEDLLQRGDAVRLIEWPEMIDAWLPSPRLHVTLQLEGDARRATLQCEDKAFLDALKGLWGRKPI